MNNYEKYNLIVEKYLKQSEVKGAIMLTAPWGSGKSYYVERSLKEYLKNKFEIINISLYGISSIHELNNVLLNNYIARIKFIKQINQTIDNKCNTLIQLITSKSGVLITKLLEKINLEINDGDISKINDIFENSINNKFLIVFEDIERSKIDILELLGYVNNLTDSSNMKVLLVVNENIFLKKNDIEKNSFLKSEEKEKNEVADESIEKYLKSKEKTIIDTIHFEPENDEVINNIVLHFDKKYGLNNNTFTKYKETIVSILKNRDCYNYRILIFALQKVIDYFGESINSRNSEFFHVVLSSILRFAIQERAHIESDGYGDNDTIGIYSLQNYVCGDIAIAEDIDVLEKRYVEYINEWNKDDYANNIIEGKLKWWFIHEQKEFEIIIQEVLDSIKNGKIKYDYYKDIMYFLLPLRDFVDNGNVIDEIKDICLKNIAEGDIDIDNLLSKEYFGHDLFIESGGVKYEEYKKFVKEYNQILNTRQKNNFCKAIGFDSLSSFTKEIHRNEKSIHQSHEFLKNIDILMLNQLIKKSKPKEIWELRGQIHMIYEMSNLKDIYPNDKDNIDELKNKCEFIFEQEQDKIKKQNIKWLINDLIKYSKLYN